MPKGRITGSDPADYTHATNELLIEQHNPEGEIYYIYASDPGYAYILAPDRLELIRLPIGYVDWSKIPLPSGAESQQAKVGQMREFTTTAVQGRWPVCYGTVRVGSAIGPIGASVADPRVMYVQHILGHGEWDSLQQTILPYNGTTTSLANLTGLLAPFAGSVIGQFYPGVLNPTSSIHYITVTNGGSGYGSAPTVTLSGGGGSGCVAFASVVGGAVVAVGVSVAGSGYYAQPTVSFSGGGGTGAAAQAFLWPDVRAFALLGNNAVQTYPGLAHIWMQYTYDSVVLPQPVVQQAKFIAKAKKVYDPRKDSSIGGSGSHRADDPTTWEWSDNDSLCTADYLRNTFYGTGRVINDWSSWAEEADYCDQVMPDFTKRHRLNIVLMRDASERANLDTLRLHFRATIFPRDGGWVVRCAKARSVSQVWTQDDARPGNLKLLLGDQKPSRVRATYTDPSKDYQPTPSVAETDDVRFGTEDVRTADYTFEGIDNPGEAARAANWLLYSRQILIGSVDMIPVRAKGLYGEVGDRIQYTSTELPLAAQDLTIDRTAWVADQNTFRYSCSQYPANAFNDLVAASETPVSVSGPGPLDALPAPTGLALTEQVDTTQPGVFVPKLIIDFTPYAGPFNGGTQIGYTVSGGPERFLPVQRVSPAVLAIPEGLGKAVVVNAYTINENTRQRGPASTLSHTMYDGSSPEPPGEFLFGTDSAGNAIVWLEGPPIRSTTLYSAGFWTSTGMTTFVAANVNDGLFVNTAAVFGNSSWIRIDFGSAKQIREFLFYSATALASWPTIDVAYSDNGTTFTTCAPIFTTLTDAGGLHRKVAQIPSTIGSHRYMFITVATGTAAAFVEIQPIEYTGTWPYAKGVRVTGYLPNKGLLVADGQFHTRDFLFWPTSSNAIRRGDFTYNFSLTDVFLAQTNGGSKFEMDVATISVADTASDVRSTTASSAFSSTGTPGPQEWLPVKGFDVTLSSGVDNNDIAVPNNVDLVVLRGTLSGTTGITGFTNGYVGRIIVIRNAANTAVRFKSNVTSTAANRCQLPVSVFDLASGGDITLIYDDDAGAGSPAPRWRPLETSLIGILGLASGGTAADLSGTGGAGQVLKQTSAGAAVTVAALVAGDIPNIAESQVTNLTTDLAAKAPLANPVFTTGIKERSLSVPMGEWTSFTPTMGAGGGATWSGGSITAQYMRVGKTLWVDIDINGSSLNIATNTLTITIPNSLVAAAAAVILFAALDNASPVTGVAKVASGGTSITISRDLNNSVNWTVASSTSRHAFVFAFPIQ